MMDPLQTETDEPLEIPNFVHADQALVRSFTLKEEGMLSKRKSAKASFCFQLFSNGFGHFL